LGSVFHVNVPALLTGLGIGGVAIALAGKETVENFIAAFTILTDKPFEVGDHVKLLDVEGFVERIGFRSTRIRGFGGAEIIIPNNKLVSQNLINLTSGETQGMKLVLNIRYGITQEKLMQLISLLKEMLQATLPVKEPVDIQIDTFNVETMQLIINYHLPQPLPQEYDFSTLRNNISLKVYGLICEYAVVGAADV
jgi:MscS family membrane protein